MFESLDLYFFDQKLLVEGPLSILLNKFVKYLVNQRSILAFIKKFNKTQGTYLANFIQLDLNGKNLESYVNVHFS